MFDPVQINKLYTFIKRAKQTETTHKGRTKELRQKNCKRHRKSVFEKAIPHAALKWLYQWCVTAGSLAGCDSNIPYNIFRKKGEAKTTNENCIQLSAFIV